VAPKFAGRVFELTVREGDVVSAGQVLVRLEDRAVEARLEQALAAQASSSAQLAAQQSAIVLLRTETAVAVLGVMHAGYGVPLRGSVALFFAVVALFTMVCAGVGIVASGFARNSGQMGLIVILVVVPMVMLSGTWNMVEGMPGWLQLLTELSPLRHFIVLACGILIRGADLDMLWPALLKMLALGASLFAIGVLRFRRQYH
jgi:ABC-2 type transport system permease protein